MVLLGFSMGLMIWAPTLLWAIVRHPSSLQILEAIQTGREGARNKIPPIALFWHFGSSDENTRPHGFLMTKLTGIAVLASHFALRGEEPASQDIQRILDEEVLQVVVIVFGDSPGFAIDSYLMLKQGNQLLKPDRVRFDARASLVSQEQGKSVFRAKIVGSFFYEALDLEALTTLKVFPGSGGEVTFYLDFSAIP